MIYLSIWARGLVIVTLVSLNTRLLSDGRWSAVVVATVLSAVWWMNTKTAAKRDGYGAMIAYSLGAGCGTALGLWLGGI